MRIFEFLKREILVAHVYGIPVRVDYRWFFVLALMTWLTATSRELAALVESDFAKFAFGLITTLVFFASIFFHELAHAVAARFEGVEVREIVLHPFGGLARLRREPDNPRAEFRIAIAGPAASFLLALVFAGLMAISNSLGTNILTPLFFLLFFLNLLLAVFNMFPGYPLDGGRVLRAYLWRRGRNLDESTVLTGRAGQIIAIALVVFGLFVAAGRNDFFTGLWTVLVGLFLYDSARGIIRQINESENVKVEDVMSPPAAIAPDASVSHFVDAILPLHRRTVFPIADDGRLYGVLLLEDLKILPRDAWQKTKVRNAMRPVTNGYFVETGTLFSEAREIMRGNGIGALGVVDAGGRLVGFLQRGKVRRSA